MRYSPMIHHVHQHTHVDWARVGIVVLILLVRDHRQRHR